MYWHILYASYLRMQQLQRPILQLSNLLPTEEKKQLSQCHTLGLKTKSLLMRIIMLNNTVYSCSTVKNQIKKKQTIVYTRLTQPLNIPFNFQWTEIIVVFHFISQIRIHSNQDLILSVAKKNYSNYFNIWLNIYQLERHFFLHYIF